MDIKLFCPHLSLCVLFGLFQTLASVDPISDSILFNLNWAGPLGQNEQVEVTNQAILEGTTSIFMTTKNNEKYECVLPNENENLKQEHRIEDYKGLSAFELIQPLFKQTMCSYRLESYWTYELCHGKSLRQFHEDKELGKKSKLQQYDLGTFNDEENKKRNEAKQGKKIPILKVEGTELPYYEVIFGNGTKCDLTGAPRQALVRYVCQPGGKGEVYEFKEVSTCEYALIVLTNQLCMHPAYESKKESVNEIKCHSMDGSPAKPLGMEHFVEGSSRDKYNSRDAKVVHVELQEPQAAAPRRVETPISPVTDQQTLNSFLSGDHCLHGGSPAGWWRHEFCFGKKLTQYHQVKNGKRVDVILGMWDAGDHTKWIQQNPSKAPKARDVRKNVIHYYGKGDVCEVTGKNRFTEIKLKCAENEKQPHAISIYLLEPNQCEYLLVVESNIFCDLVKEADDVTGIIPTN